MKKRVSAWNRRSFIKAGLGGVAGLGVSLGLGSEQTQASPSQRKTKFVFRTLGRTGIRLPVVSLGIMNSDNPNLVKSALDWGVVMLDTAWGYMRGRNEEMIGQVIKGRPRESFVLATKVPGIPGTREGLFTAETTGEAFIERFDQSLKRLGLEYVDILYLHNVWKKESALFEPLMKALEKVKKEGKTRFVGLSTHQNEPEVIDAIAEGGFYDVVLTAINFREDHHPETTRAIAKAAKAGMGIVAMKTQAGAYWDKEKQMPINMKAALKWVLQDPNIHTAIPGCTTFEQLAEDLSVMENLSLTDQEKADLIPPKNVAGFYCQNCGQCLKQCPQRLPIPELMRSYMYVHAYRNFLEGHDLVRSLDLPAQGCNGCSSCSVHCRLGMPVAQRVREMMALRDLPAAFFA